MAMNALAYSIQNIVKDERKLRCWTSMLLKGITQSLQNYCQHLNSLARLRLSIHYPMSRGKIEGNCHGWLEFCIWGSCMVDVNPGLTRHDMQMSWKSPPPTCTQSRSAPLDIIFTPNSFHCWRGGYLELYYLEGDHSGVWFNIPVEFILQGGKLKGSHSKSENVREICPRTADGVWDKTCQGKRGGR